MCAATDLIQKLRSMTGAGVVDCKVALTEAKNDIDKAIQYLREKGMASAVKKAERIAKQGLVYSYIHSGGKLGVLLELNCETDFVARTEDFQNLCKEVAMQVAAANPLYLKRDEVPGDVLEKEREIYKAQLKEEGKPENVWDKIIIGKIEKFYSQVCLMDQPYIRDTSGKEKISTLITSAVGKIGENIVVRRFARFVLGEY
jgi:elongation factor Ts